jgi:hypothetical protein
MLEAFFLLAGEIAPGVVGIADAFPVFARRSLL